MHSYRLFRRLIGLSVLLALWMFVGKQVYAQAICDSYNAIVTLNGVFATRVDAQRNLIALKSLVYPQLSVEEKLHTRFEYIYNDTSALTDLSETILQSQGLTNTRFWQALAGIGAFPPSVTAVFNDAAAQQLFVANNLDQITVSRLKSEVQRYINAGNRVVLVAHSQGNLYSNSFVLSPSSLSTVDRQSFATVNVAVPDSAANGSLTGYSTLYSDLVIYPFAAAVRLIAGAPPPLIPNVDNGLISAFTTVLGHSFSVAYLGRNPSRDRIVQDTLSTMRQLSFPASSCAQPFKAYLPSALAGKSASVSSCGQPNAFSAITIDANGEYMGTGCFTASNYPPHGSPYQFVSNQSFDASGRFLGVLAALRSYSAGTGAQRGSVSVSEIAGQARVSTSANTTLNSPNIGASFSQNIVSFDVSERMKGWVKYISNRPCRASYGITSAAAGHVEINDNDITLKDGNNVIVSVRSQRWWPGIKTKSAIKKNGRHCLASWEVLRLIMVTTTVKTRLL